VAALVAAKEDPVVAADSQPSSSRWHSIDHHNVDRIVHVILPEGGSAVALGATSFFDQEGIAELYEWRTRSYRADFELLGRLVSEGGGAVLDAACGAGRATGFLATIARPVVGIDRSARMLRLARARTQDLEHPPLLVQGDLVALPLGARFSLITFLCNSFVDLVRREDQLGCLRSLRDRLGPDGRLLIDITPAEAYERIDGQEIEVPCSGPRSGRRVECRLLSTIRSPERRLERIGYRFYEGDTLKSELQAEHERALISHSQFLELAGFAGLEPVEVLGSYAGEPYADGSPWQIYVLRSAAA
jgi:SAM-dependent methyltransferase